MCEPDVSPLAVQGPKAEDLLAALFGERIRAIRFFKFGWIEFEGTRQLIARSGYSRQGGFEIYLQGAHLGSALWDAIWNAGRRFNIAPGCPNLIERIEGGLFSYGNEMTRKNNPFEIGLGKYCSIDGSIEYIGRDALQEIALKGHQREVRGIVFGQDPCRTCSKPWPVSVGDVEVGQVTSAMWSPRLSANVGHAMIDRNYWSAGQSVSVLSQDGEIRLGQVVPLPIGEALA